MSANRRIKPFACVKLGFASITSSYATWIGPIAGRGVVILITNSLNNEVFISLDGGTTDFLWLPTASGIAIDLSANNAEYSGTIAIKDLGSHPNAGSICASVLRVE